MRARTRDDLGGILILLALGLIFRVIIAYLLPGSGFANDIGAFQYWASNLASQGLHGFYERDFFHDYTPGYLYVLWVVGLVGSALGGVGDLIKVPPILGDVALAWLVWSMARELGASRAAARLGAIVVLVNPITWFDSVIWGQVDSFGLVFLLLGLRELWRDRPERAAVWTVVAAIIKPQLGILIPIVAAVTIRRALWPVGGFGDEDAPAVRRTTTDWEQRTRGRIRIVTTGIAGFLTAVALSWPFGLSLPGLVEQIFKTAGGYPYVSVNAWNPWALVSLNGSGIAANHLWVCDMIVTSPDPGRCPEAFMIAGIPAVIVGTVLTLAAFLAASVIVARRPDRLTILVGLTVLAVAFFVLPTRVHERYLFPLVALGAILAAVSGRWRWAYLVASVATFANMYVVLTVLYPDNPGISDWLGVGPAIGSTPAIVMAALAQAGVFLFAAGELRAASTRRIAARLAAATSNDVVVPDDPASADDPVPEARFPVPMEPAAASAPSTSAPASPAGRAGTALAPIGPSVAATAVWDARPSAGQIGYLGWFRDRLAERPTRRDRSRELHGEGGGRLDRLDLWVVLVLVAVLLTTRMWRLAEPYQMHFDEVYHPRTAIEFLQAWRYGLSHDIYEWTHPHLAKYAMTAGIVAWGDDRTSATSDLGVAVAAAVVEPRWDPATSSRVAGDRLWVATGSAVRAYDLATRALIVSIPVPGAAVITVDEVAHRILVGTDAGQIGTIDTESLDKARRDGSEVKPGSVPVKPFASLDEPVRFLDVAVGGATIIAVLEPANPVAADRPMTAVVIDSASASEVGRADLARVAQIANAGTGVVALAAADGIAFLDTTSAKITATVVLAGPPEGLAFANHLDKDRLYATYQATDGPKVATVTAPGSTGTPQLETSLRLPGTTGSWVGYDSATRMVHVLGTRPGSGEPTVYVIEPHANAVYADAALPFAPTALAFDANERYPSSDRQQLLALSAAGGAATIEAGKHAFAWRLPGVLAGILMAALLYLLARALFRRRVVAIFLAVLVAVDGMLFAQSRIGMNDAYVGLGIVAAYLIFALLWRSPGNSRRHRLAFAVGMPAIGVSLGFALAAKWVAAYAIGGLGILVLVRSALGRLLLVGGLILATTVLGYMALSVPVGTTGGNYLFMALMVGLTLVAVTACIFHPIAWTDDEERLLVWGPAAVGGLVLLGSIATGIAGRTFALGSLAISPPEVAFGLVILSGLSFTTVNIVGRWGFGPRGAPAPADDPSRFLAPPDPAPDSWLRPGKFLGLPMVWTLVCLIAIPVALYVVSYLPWAFVEDHRILTSWPPGHQGQTLADLTVQMYRYHNNLSSGHAASSPWWAWAFDLKPVWFYQDGFAGGTAAAIYDAGNLVAWWFAVPAIAFASWQAFVRRSPALALVAIAFACQWLAWSRIDRAAFQYHYYTGLPFAFLALAYFLAELWHGASRRTWLLARLAAGAAILAPTALWVIHRPLCALVGVEGANPGSRACPTLIPDFILSGRALGIALVVGIGVLILIRLLLSLAEPGDDDEPGGGIAPKLRTTALAAIGVSLAFVVAAAFLDETPLIRWTDIPVEPIALIVTLALLPLAAFVATAHDARRFVAGLLVAMVGWFVLWYPNIAGLPLPAALNNAYQGLLPTYVYPFWFPVSKVDRSGAGTSLISLEPLLLLVVLTGVCLIVGYSAWVWRVTWAERASQGVEPLDAGGPGATGPPGPADGDADT